MIRGKIMRRIVFVNFFFLLLLTLARAQDLPLQSVEDGKLRTKEFVVMGYQGLLFELSSGEGPYLRTLTELLNINSDRRTDAIIQIRSMSKKHPNIMDFADAVLTMQAAAVVGAPGPNGIPVPTGPSIYSGDELESAVNHLTKGMQITVFTKGGGQFSGQFIDYAAHRLWIKGASRASFQLRDILAIDAPRL